MSAGSNIKTRADRGAKKLDKEGGLLLNGYHLLDSRGFGRVIGSQAIDVTITSPPYWNLKDYGAENQIGFGQRYGDFLEELGQVFDAIWEATRSTGSLWIVVDSIKKRGEVRLLPFDLVRRLTETASKKWFLQDVLIWRKPHTLPWSHRAKLQGHFEYILCLSKSKNFSLNLDSLRTTEGLASWWVKYPERYHPLGKSLGNVWEFEIPTQGTWGNGDISHFCPLPLEMAQRIILLSTSKKSEIVLDPFAGTGSTLLAAHSVGRKWIGLDINAKFQAMFNRQLAQVKPKRERKVAGASIGSANLYLRQLKYAVQLYKRSAPSERLSTEDIRLIVVTAGERRASPDPNWVVGTKVVFLVDDKFSAARRERLQKYLEELGRKAPLSKYQLDVTLEVRRVSDLDLALRGMGSEKVFRYAQGRFWNGAAVDRKQLLRKRALRIPDLISNIAVNERPAY